MSYQYLTAGISIINDIEYADGKNVRNRLGGCAVFAYGGIALFTDSVVLISCGGKDFWDFYGSYFDANLICKDGIYLTMPYTHHTLLKYERNGSWKEESIYGSEYFALQSENNRISYQKLKPFLSSENKGLYLDSNADEAIFSEIERIRKDAPAIRIMWEPPTHCSMNPCQHDQILQNLKQVDYYSMNLEEAAAFFGVSSREEIVDSIMDLDIPCFLREGENGSSWIENHAIVSRSAYHPELAIDVTGCGNCSSAAALYWRIEGKDYEDIVRNANIAAGICSRYEGPCAILKEQISPF